MIMRFCLVLIIAMTTSVDVTAGTRLDSTSDAERYFQRSDRQLLLEAGMTRATRHWPTVAPAARRHGIPESLFFGVAMCESAFNPTARSHRGAEGLFQFMPRTGRAYGLRSRSDRMNVAKSADAAARHLRDLYRRYRSWPLALAAYNAGEPKVNRAIRRAGSRRWSSVRRHLKAETHSYVPKVQTLADTYYPRLAGQGRDDLLVVRVRRGDTWWELARRWGVSQEALTALNGLRLWAGSEIVVPLRRYVVRSGDTLWSIARRHSCSVAEVQRVNSLEGNHIRPRQVLLLPWSGRR